MTVSTVAALASSVGFEQAQAKAWSDGTPRPLLYGVALRIAAATGTASALIVVAMWALGRDGVFAGVSALAIALAALMIAPRALLALLRGLLIVGGQIERSNVALAIGDIARTLAIVVLALAGELSVETVLAAFWLTVLIALALHAQVAGRPVRPPRDLARSQLLAGAVLTPYFLFLFLNLRLDVFLLAALDGSQAVGIYVVAVVFAELVWLVTDSIATGARERQWSADTGESLRTTAAAARMSLLVALLALPILALAAPAAIDLLFGDDFADATDALWALLPAAAAMAWWRALSAGLVRFARTRTVNGIAAAALLLNIVLNLALIPPLGIAGAALASLGSYALGGLIAARQLRLLGLGWLTLVPGLDDARRLAGLMRAALPAWGGR